MTDYVVAEPTQSGSITVQPTTVPDTITVRAGEPSVVTVQTAGQIGPQGPVGETGERGEPGPALELQATAGHLQWRVVGDTSWTDLIALSALIGPQGEQGDQGVAGDPGRSVELQQAGGYIQWRVAGSSEWVNLIALSAITGPRGDQGDAGVAGPRGEVGQPGASAYDVAVSQGFSGTEQQWLASLRGPAGEAGSPGQKGDPGDPGSPGEAGSPGADGASAYEMAVAAGFVGSEEQWLTSLRGPAGEAGSPGQKGDPGDPGSPGEAGSPGADGASAYEVAVAQGFVGTEQQWLASLVGPVGEAGSPGQKGDPGDPGVAGGDGASAYAVALANGFVGTEPEWLASLVGPKGDPGEDGSDGAAGASAYAVAVAQGFVGTEPQWLASLAGPAGEAGSPGQKGDPGSPGADGVDGASAYEVAVAQGFTGTQEQWLASLVGPAGSVGPAGASGEVGPAGPGVPAGGSPGQILTKSGAADYDTDWTDAPAGALSGLTDVEVGSPTDGQALVWNATSGKWEPGTVATEGGGGLAATRVLLDSIASQFDGSTQVFSLEASGQPFSPQDALAVEVILGGIQQAPGADYTVSGSQISFSTAPVVGLNCHIIGTTYSPASATMAALADVDATGVSDGQALLYNATSGQWEPGTPPAGPMGPSGPAGSPGASGSQGPAGPGVPSGGTTGQVLVKVDGTNYNTHWVDATTLQSSSAASVALDPTDGSVALLLHFNGSNGSTSFPDSGYYCYTLTPNGNVQISTAQSRFGGSSAYFDGNGDFLTLADATPFDLSSGSFTLECWFYPTVVDGNVRCLFNKATYGQNLSWSLGFCSTYLLLYTGNGGSNYITHNCTVTANQWYHVAVVGNGATISTYLNGTRIGIWERTFTNAGATIAIGAYNWNNPSGYFVGYMDELRFTRNLVRYSANFTPDTNPFPDASPAVANDPSWFRTGLLLHCTGASGSTSFYDESPNHLAVTVEGNAKISTDLSKFGSGSVVFSGNNDRLSVTPPASLFTGDWTFEAWVYPTSAATSTYNLIFRPANDYFRLYIWTDGKLTLYNGKITGTTVTLNQWHHVALVRKSNVYRLYLDGLQVGGTWADATSISGAIQIGYDGYANQGWKGYMNEIRISACARYDVPSFAVPTAAFGRNSNDDPNFAQTTLLLGMEGANGSTTITDSSSSPKPVTAYGGTAISTTQAKFGSSSLSTVNGGGNDYAIVDLTSGGGDLGTGDYTIEFWVYPTSYPRNDSNVFLHLKTDTGTSSTLMGADLGSVSGGGAILKGGDGSNTFFTGTTRIYTNQWTHIALTRRNGVLYNWVNGVLDSTGSDTGARNGTYLFIGKFSYATINGWGLPAYYDEFRLTKGLARYTGAFTPPTAKFADNTVPLPSPATTGQIFSDGNFMYICTAGGSPGTWKKTALSSF